MVKSAYHIDPRIGDSTFREIEGKDLFAEWLVPELYADEFASKLSNNTRREIVHLLRTEATESDLTEAERIVVRYYFRGYLNRSEHEMATSLYGFYASLENHLRKEHRKFAALCGSAMSVADICAEAERRVGGGTDKQGKQQARKGAQTKVERSLGYYLEVIMVAIESLEDAPTRDGLEGWTDCVRVRNKIAHGDIEDFLERWDEPIRATLRGMPKFRRVTNLLGAVIGQKKPLAKAAKADSKSR